MKNLLIALLTFTLLFSFSCSKEIIDFENNNDTFLVKKKLIYGSNMATTPVEIEEYFYDSNNNIERIDYSSGYYPGILFYYDIFKYNENNELVAILCYHSADEYYLHDSIAYIYNNGKLVQKETYYFVGYNEQITERFEYNNDQLIRKESFNNNTFVNCIQYKKVDEYTSIETMYNDSLCTERNTITIHTYSDKLKINSKVFLRTYDHPIQEIIFGYNTKKELVLEEAKQLDNNLQKPLSYFYKIVYEYY